MARPRRPDPDAARRAEEGLRAIEAGGIPPAAQRAPDGARARREQLLHLAT